MIWPVPMIVRLSALSRQKMSADRIADKLAIEFDCEVTRNMVIGKRYRLGLSKPHAYVLRPRVMKAKAAAKRKTNHSKPLSVSIAKPSKIALALPAGSHHEIPVPISRGLSLMQLTDKTCKFPYGDPKEPGFSFCGHAPEEGRPYCEAHARLAYSASEGWRTKREYEWHRLRRVA